MKPPANPEQPVLDAIDELVDWQMEEGAQRERATAAAERAWFLYVTTAPVPLMPLHFDAAMAAAELELSPVPAFRRAWLNAPVPVRPVDRYTITRGGSSSSV